MGFKCGITGKHSGSNVKPVVVTYYVETEYNHGSFVTRGREVLREVRALPSEAPAQREVLVEGLRTIQQPQPVIRERRERT